MSTENRDETSGPLEGETNVAIACQGGGSHTAFTAGVLRELFAEWPDEARLVGISGSSGGAICALAAWYGLLAEEHTPSGRLRAVWEELTAQDPFQQTMNEWMVWGSKIERSGAPVPEFSPYQLPVSDWGQRYLRQAMEAAVEFDRVPELAGEDVPRLVVGTVDVNGGEFEVFCDGAVNQRAVLASAAVPHLYEAVEIDGHYHWDGLFSQNPPVHELMSVDTQRKPEQLWVIQINPQEREGEPTSLVEIKDRRNELSGNISLNQELRFIERVNEWVEAGHLPESEFTKTGIARIELDRELEYASKLNRSPDFVEELREDGERAGAQFLAERDERLTYSESEDNH